MQLIGLIEQQRQPLSEAGKCRCSTVEKIKSFSIGHHRLHVSKNPLPKPGLAPYAGRIARVGEIGRVTVDYVKHVVNRTIDRLALIELNAIIVRKI